MIEETTDPSVRAVCWVRVVGTGRVATALAHRLGPLVRLSGRDRGALEALSKTTKCHPDLQWPPVNISEECVVIATSDASISEVAELCVHAATRPVSMLHCSGGIDPEEAFASFRERLAGWGVLHPLCAVNHGRTFDEPRYFGVAGDRVGTRQAEEVARKLGGRSFPIPRPFPRYHAAAVFASNYILTSLAAARAVCPEIPVKALFALAASVVEDRPPSLEGALTGPIARGDTATIAAHLRHLEVPLRQLYLDLGRATAHLLAPERISVVEAAHQASEERES